MPRWLVVVGWAGSLVSVGAMATIGGYVSAARAPRVVVASAPPREAPPPSEPARGDQSRFLDVDLNWALAMADPSREWWFRVEPLPTGDFRGPSGAFPMALAIKGSEPGPTVWEPLPRSEFRHGQYIAHPTGRTSLGMEPIDLKDLDGRRWELLTLNYPEAIRLAQHFNAGDLVEVWRYGVKGQKEYVWVLPSNLRGENAPPRRKIDMRKVHGSP